MRFALLVRASAVCILSASGVLFSAQFSYAQEASPLERLIEADANEDGDVSWEEVVGMRETMFSRLDRNEDEFVDGEDRGPFGFRDRFRQAVEEVTARFDANGDDRVSKSELVDAPAPLFEEGDTNDDDVLSADEIAALN